VVDDLPEEPCHLSRLIPVGFPPGLKMDQTPRGVYSINV